MVKIICNSEDFSKLVNACYGSTNCNDCALSSVCTENPQELVNLCTITKSNWQQELGEFLKNWKQKYEDNEKGSINEHTTK